MNIKTTMMVCLLFPLLVGCVSNMTKTAQMVDQWRQNEVTGILQGRVEYFKANPNLSSDVKEVIEKGFILRKMTAEEVLLAWGKPTSKNTSVGAYGKHEQWIYREDYYRREYIAANIRRCYTYADYYLYFENGVLDSWQEIR